MLSWSLFFAQGVVRINFKKTFSAFHHSLSFINCQFFINNFKWVFTDWIIEKMSERNKAYLAKYFGDYIEQRVRKKFDYFSSLVYNRLCLAAFLFTTSPSSKVLWVKDKGIEY